MHADTGIHAHFVEYGIPLYSLKELHVVIGIYKQY